MVILSIAWSLFDENYNVKRNGASIMTYNICEYVGRKEKSYFFCGAIKTADVVVGNFYVLNNQKYLVGSRDSNHMDKWHEGLSKRLIEIINEVNPDMVLIHGIGEFEENCIRVCVECKQAYAYVNHSYFGKGDDNYDKENIPKWEDQIFSIPDIHIIMVGNGMRNRMLHDYPDFPKERVVAIPNGTHFAGEIQKSNYVEKYREIGKKVLVCVGRVYKRKNQEQLTRIIKNLPKEVKSALKILVCGGESPKDPGIESLKRAIRKECVDEEVIYIGDLDETGMKGLYSLADGLIMPSISEGLSLVSLEMLTYGKPVILFSDNETATDVNDECAVVLANDRSDEALADAVKIWFYKEWNEYDIKQYAERFSMERVAEDYIRYCRKRKEEVGCDE